MAPECRQSYNFTFINNSNLNWTQQCGHNSTIVSYFVQNSVKANVTTSNVGTAGGPGIAIQSNQQIKWDPLAGVDEYAIMILSQNSSFGTVLQAINLQPNQAGKLSYQFSNAFTIIGGAFVFVYGYSSCDKSPASAGKSVSS